MRNIALCLALSGCSVAFQAKPSAGKAQCSESPMLAVVDTVVMIGGAGGVVTGAAIGGDTGNVIAGASALAGVLYLASASNGYKWAGQCRDQRAPGVAVR